MAEYDKEEIQWGNYVELLKEEGSKNVFDEIDYDCVCYDDYWLWQGRYRRGENYKSN